MQTQNPMRDLKTLMVAFLTSWTPHRILSLLYPATRAEAAPADKRKPGLYWTLETDKGKISCKLFEAEAPVTVRTMVGLAIGKISYVHPEAKQVERKKFFDGLTFHRVIPGVMIQGGDLLGTGVGHPEGPGFPYKNEIAPSLKFDTPGRLAMANSGPDTNDTQFFITEAAYPSFNGKYTIWGQCENADVVKAIARVFAMPATCRSCQSTFSAWSSSASARRPSSHPKPCRRMLPAKMIRSN